MNNFVKLIWILTLLFNSMYAKTQDSCNVIIVDTISLQKAFYVIYTDTMSDYKNTKYRRATFFLEDTIDLKYQGFISDQIFENNYLYIGQGSLYTILMVNDCKEIFNRYEDIEISHFDSILIKKEYEKGLMSIYSIYSPLGFIKIKLAVNSYYGYGSLNRYQYKGEYKYLRGITPVVGIKREDDE